MRCQRFFHLIDTDDLRAVWAANVYAVELKVFSLWDFLNGGIAYASGAAVLQSIQDHTDNFFLLEQQWDRLDYTYSDKDYERDAMRQIRFALAAFSMGVKEYAA